MPLLTVEAFVELNGDLQIMENPEQKNFTIQIYIP
jgi:hypothetical protein